MIPKYVFILDFENLPFCPRIGPFDTAEAALEWASGNGGVSHVRLTPLMPPDVATTLSPELVVGLGVGGAPWPVERLPADQRMGAADR